MAYSVAYKDWLFNCGNRSEYIIYRAIEEFSRQREERGDRPVSLSEGVALRQQILKNLESNPEINSYVSDAYDIGLKSLSNRIQMNPILMSIQAEGSFTKIFSGKSYDNVSKEQLDSIIVTQENKAKDRRESFIESINEVLPGIELNEEKFNNLITTYTNAVVSVRNNGSYSYEPAVPLSPYCPAFTTRSFTYKNPALSLMKKSDKQTADGNYADFVRIYHPTRDDIEDQYDDFIRFYKAEYATFGENTKGRGDSAKTNIIKTDVPTFYTNEDDFYLNGLRKYLTEEDAAKVIKHCNRFVDRTGTPYKRANMKKSMELLQRIAEAGYDYTIVPKAGGQVDCRVSVLGSNYDISMIPQPNQSFAYNFGRVFCRESGVSYNLNTQNKSPEKGYKYEPYEASVTDAMNLLKFAMGEPVTVDTKNNVPLGKHRLISFNTPKGTVYRNNAYYNKGNEQIKNFTAYYGRSSDGVNVFLKANTSEVTPKTARFGRKGVSKEEDAELHLKEWIESARQTYTDEMDLENLIREARDHQNDPDYEFRFSGVPEIYAMQKNYWNVLTGKEHSLAKVGQDDDEFDEVGVERAYYEGSPEDKVRQHFADSIHHDIGTFEPDANGKRYSIYGLTNYAVTDFNSTRFRLSVVAATNLLGFKPDELQDTDAQGDSVKNMLIRYDEKTAQPIFHHESKFVRNMGSVIKDTLQQSGIVIEDDDITIDDNGIVQYKGKKVINGEFRRDPKAKRYGTVSIEDGLDKPEEVVGHIGQIFAPEGKYNTVTTKFAGTKNYMFVPGYTAKILPQKDGENLPYEARTRLLGYEQLMSQRIRSQLRSDLFMTIDNYDGAALGMNTSLNKVYTNLYDVRHPVDYIERSREEGMDDSFLEAVLATEARRVRYDSVYKEQATLNAYYQAYTHKSTLIDDRNVNPLTLTGFRNMAIMTEEGDGYFDPDATSTGMNQGVTRYLVESAEVLPDGSIKRGDLDDKTPLCKHPVMHWADYVPFDRRQMVFNNAIKAQCITGKVKTAQMTFGGWNFDDGFIVTKQFAETYKVRNKDDVLRDIVVGDKILDKNGNKGVISLVIDPDMSMEEAREQGLENVLAMVKANPDIQVYGAPYPAVSRFNGGTARELMENPSDLHMPDGTVKEGCVGEAEFIVTHMAVDKKSQIYDDQAFEEGKGSRASAQLAWALNARGAEAMMREFYSDNDRAFTTMREYFITCGYDLSETGQIMRGYTPHPGEIRNVFAMEEIEDMPKEGLTQSAIRSKVFDMTRQIRHSGGFMELPFPLTFPNGTTIPQVQIEHDVITEADKTDVNYTKDSWTVNRNGKEITYHRNQELLDNGGSKLVDRKISDAKKPIYALPVMSSHLRVDQPYQDGTTMLNDCTEFYQYIYRAGLTYLEAERKGDKAAMTKARSDAQRFFDRITGDIVENRFEDNKHNYFKEGLMSNRMPKSSNPVWTADPRLDIDEVGVSPEMAERLELEEGETVLTFRNPVLRPEGVSAKKVKILKGIVGIAINPVMDKGYDGDFDGDTVPLKKMLTPEAREEAERLYSVKATLLDYGSKDEDGNYALLMNHGLDLKTAEYNRPELKDQYDEITKRVNGFEKDYASGKLSYEEVDKMREQAVKDLNDYVHKCFEGGVGEAIISYKDISSHVASCEEIVKSGAKGSYGKLDDYCNYLGASYEYNVDENGEKTSINLDTVEDLETPFGGDNESARQASMATQYATSVKTMVGVAGKSSQRGMKALRNACPQAVLEMTYPVTQGLLQAKHDPVDARQKYATVMDSVRSLWKGYKLDLVQVDMLDENGHKLYDENGDTRKTEIYVKEYDDNHQPARATKEEFMEQMKAIYSRKDMLNVAINDDYVKEVANNLVGPDGLMRSVEDPDVGSPMDRLAYKNADVRAIDLLDDMAKKGEGIFDGKYNLGFAPRAVMRNINREYHNINARPGEQIRELDIIAKKDTLDKKGTSKPVYNQEDVEFRKSKIAEFVAAKRKVRELNLASNGKYVISVVPTEDGIESEDGMRGSEGVKTVKDVNSFIGKHARDGAVTFEDEGTTFAFTPTDIRLVEKDEPYETKDGKQAVTPANSVVVTYGNPDSDYSYEYRFTVKTRDGQIVKPNMAQVKMAMNSEDTPPVNGRRTIETPDETPTKDVEGKIP